MKSRALAFVVAVAGVIIPPVLTARSDDATLRAGATGPSVPRLIRYSGVASDASGKPLTGTVALTFSVYEKEDDNLALWHETQEVTADAHGRYNVLLGSTTPEGMPAEIFESGRARWVGVQVDNQPERPRTLLISVPYALKAGDAETLGGKPLSAFVLANPTSPTASANSTMGSPSSGLGSTISIGSGGALTASVGGSGTTNILPIWTSSSMLGNSAVYQNGQNIGIGNSAPSTALEVSSNLLENAPTITMTNSNSPAGGVGVILQGKSGSGSQMLGEISFGGAGPAGSGGLLDFFTSPDGKTYSQRMRITNAGNVGIGTVAPSTALEVSTNLLENAPTITMTNSNSPAGGVGVILQGKSGSGAQMLGEVSFGGAGPSGSGGLLDLSTSADGKTCAPRMRITNTGNIGIGTLQPTAPLDVVGQVKVEGNGNGITFPDGTVQTTAAKPTPAVVYSTCASNTASSVSCSCPRVLSAVYVSQGASCTTNTANSCTASSSPGCPGCFPATPPSYGSCCVCQNQ